MLDDLSEEGWLLSRVEKRDGRCIECLGEKGLSPPWPSIAVPHCMHNLSMSVLKDCVSVPSDNSK